MSHVQFRHPDCVIEKIRFAGQNSDTDLVGPVFGVRSICSAAINPHNMMSGGQAPHQKTTRLIGLDFLIVNLKRYSFQWPTVQLKHLSSESSLARRSL